MDGMMFRSLALAVAGLVLASCAGNSAAPEPRAVGPVVYPMPSSAVAVEYTIGTGDVLDVVVFQVPGLSKEDVLVDSAGDIQLPLIGAIRAAGLTAPRLAEDIRGRLDRQYLRDPSVSVSVTEAASQKVSVDGSVVDPGVFEMKGPTTLMQAVAMAKGPTRFAELRRVAVFRTIDATPMVAVYDLSAIRRGDAGDPQVLANDVVVVDGSARSAWMRDLLTVLPSLALFTQY